MKNRFFKKIRIFLKSIKIFKNWYLYPIVYFGLTKKKYVIFETKENIKIKLRVQSTDLMALTNVWLIQEYYKPGFEIHDKDILIDIGAHIGLFALFASRKCKKGKIFCYEPVKENFDLLLENLQLNNLDNIIPFNLAVSNHKSTITIFLNKDESAHSIFPPNSALSIKVKSTSLKNIFDENNLEWCDYLKLDCEGAEYDIINSTSEEYFKRIKKIAAEYHLADTKPELLENLIIKLKAMLFDVSTRAIFEDIGFIYAIKQTE